MQILQRGIHLMEHNKFYTHSLGCKVNAYETEALSSLLLEKGMIKTDFIKEAEVIILNTCAVTATAAQKSRQHIRSYRESNPEAILIVMGCYSQSEGKKCADMGANIVLGSGKRKDAVELIERFKADRQPIIDVVNDPRKQDYEEFGTAVLAESARAYLKVQDGCDAFCSYCYIPRLRGNSRSRDPREVIKEAQKLVELGYKELIITGIHIGYYGKDLGLGLFRLPDLLHSLCVKCPSLPRIRISSLEVSEIDKEFLSVLSRHHQIVDHLHIPLQSGSDAILQKMNRPYNTREFLNKLKQIRAIRPNIAITTDLIAGFPGESEVEWGETMRFCEEANFAEIHVFPFSPRPLTPAEKMPCQVEPAIKKRRVHEMLVLSKKLRLEYERKFYNKRVEVLVEEVQGNHFKGHTSNYLLVEGDLDNVQEGTMVKTIYNSESASD